MGDRNDRNDRGERRERNKNFKKKKVCSFCVDKVDYIDYKDLGKLKKYLSDRGKILPRRITGNCAVHQRALTSAVKRARVIAFLPYITD